VGLLVCTLVALLLGGAPHGQRSLDTTIQDDAVLLHGSDASVRQATRQIAALGASYVRVTAGWSTLAPQTKSRRMPPSPFDPGDPLSYGFHELDRAVLYASQAGLKVMIDVAFWAPRWAVTRASPDGHHRYMPDPALFGAFARAVARRYSGAYRYPADPRRRLPAVRLFTIWNEPNQAQFLEPQWRRTSTGWIAESPHIYRRLYEAAYDAIKAVDARDLVLIGGTAASGSSTPGRGDLAPMEFVRSLACVDRSLAPLRIPECRDYSPLRADGYAHHPYSLRTTPAAHASNPDQIPLADTPRLERLLHTLYLDRRITSDLPMYETEYGYKTNPPDRQSRWTPADQARFMGWSTYLAWRDPNTRMFAQFLLRDSLPGRGYRSGLYYADGSAKPAAQAFRLPFWVQRVATIGPPLVLVFGQVRPAGGARALVQVSRLDPGANAWAPVPTLERSCEQHAAFLTDSGGFLLTGAMFHPGSAYRLGWRRSDGTWEYSVPISPDQSAPLGGDGTETQPGSVLRGLAR
jgi:hypothetical protein